jgi:hypothetical protein
VIAHRDDPLGRLWQESGKEFVPRAESLCVDWHLIRIMINKWRDQESCKALLPTDFKSVLDASPSLTKRYEAIFTGLAAVKVMLRPAMSRDRLSSS